MRGLDSRNTVCLFLLLVMAYEAGSGGKHTTLTSEYETDESSVEVKRKSKVSDYLKQPVVSSGDEIPSRKKERALRRERKAAQQAALLAAANAEVVKNQMDFEEASLKRKAEKTVAEDKKKARSTLEIAEVHKPSNQDGKKKISVECCNVECDETVECCDVVKKITEGSKAVSGGGNEDGGRVSASIEDGVVSNAGSLNASVVPRSATKDGKVEVEGKNNMKIESEVRVSVALIKKSVIELISGGKVDPNIIIKVSDISANYEGLIMDLVVDNARLRGRIDVLGQNRCCRSEVASQEAPRYIAQVPTAKNSIQKLEKGASLQVASVPTGRPSYAQVVSPAGPIAVPPVVRPVNKSFEFKVNSKGKQTSKEVCKKLKEEVVPKLGTRVKDVKVTKTGVVISFPSSKERDDVAKSNKFEEAGLVVELTKRLGPKLVVKRVEKRIPVEDFLDDLHKLNLSQFTKEEFEKEVRIVGGRWTSGEGQTSVTLECSDRMAQVLRKEGRCYIKHFSFYVDEQSPVRSCFKCLSMDHGVRFCRAKESICRRCGQAGHAEKRCREMIHCRDCSFRGHSAGHFMLSMDCPIYRAAVDRVAARN